MIEHPFAYLKKRADLKSCCHKDKNLRVVDRGYGIIVGVCIVCGRKHRKMTAEPGVYNFSGATLINARPVMQFPHRKILKVLG